MQEGRHRAQAMRIKDSCNPAPKSDTIKMCLSTGRGTGFDTAQTGQILVIKHCIYTVRSSYSFSFKEHARQVPACTIYCDCITAGNLATRAPTALQPQNCRSGQGHDQIPGLLCKKPKQAARHSMHCTKNPPHTGGGRSLLQLRWQISNIRHVLMPATGLKETQDRNKISFKACVLFGAYRRITGLVTKCTKLK